MTVTMGVGRCMVFVVVLAMLATGHIDSVYGKGISIGESKGQARSVTFNSRPSVRSSPSNERLTSSLVRVGSLA